MKLFQTVFFLSLFSPTIIQAAAVGKELKLEGNCHGSLIDATPISLTYYSDFDGCRKVSRSAIAFNSGFEGLITGSRAFKVDRDIYNFPKHKLSFLNSTGNTSALFEYRDASRELQSVELQCEVRDYEYPDCSQP